MQARSYQLLGVLQSYAPDSMWQEKLAEDYRLCQAEGLSEDALILALAGRLIDGLRHGNWPWVDMNLREH